MATERTLWVDFTDAPSGAFRTNIAGGSKRVGKADFARFLNIAEGSLVETESLLMVSRDLGFVSRDQCTKHLNEIAQIARMLHGLHSKVEKGTLR